MEPVGHRVCVALASFSLVACAKDKDAALYAANRLAADAYREIAIADACPGGKLSLCSTEQPTSIESVGSDDPHVLEIVSGSDVPAEVKSSTTPEGTYFQHGLSPGQTKACIRAVFDDGSRRTACTEVAVRAVDDVRVAFVCEDSSLHSDEPHLLVAPGQSLGMQVELVGGGELLSGAIVHPLDDAELRRTSPMGYQWSSPAGGGQLALRSPLDPKLSVTLETYGPDRVTQVVATPNHVPPRVLAPGRSESFTVIDEVDGRPVCYSLPPAVRSETPNICTGPNGETEWNTQAFSAVSEGTCQLSIGVAGGAGYTTSLSVPFYFVDPADAVREGEVGSKCATQGQRTCATGRGNMVICKLDETGSLRWTFDASCNGQLCDFTAPADACSATSGCVACR